VSIEVTEIQASGLTDTRAAGANGADSSGARQTTASAPKARCSSSSGSELAMSPTGTAPRLSDHPVPEPSRLAVRHHHLDDVFREPSSVSHEPLVLLDAEQLPRALPVPSTSAHRRSPSSPLSVIRRTEALPAHGLDRSSTRFRHLSQGTRRPAIGWAHFLPPLARQSCTFDWADAVLRLAL
jgi:hypothetical protein